MMHAPDMSPTLDDALRALDGASVNGVISATQLAAVRGFLAQLDDVREVPATVLDPAQAARMEGAYQVGVRCADESGHVLVVSLPAFLELFPPPAAGAWLPVSIPRRDGLLAPFGRMMDWFVQRPTRVLALALAVGANVAAFVDHDTVAAVWLAVSALALVGSSWLVDSIGPVVASCPPDCEDCRHGR